jgi:hypothetical protein
LLSVCTLKGPTHRKEAGIAYRIDTAAAVERVLTGAAADEIIAAEPEYLIVESRAPKRVCAAVPLMAMRISHFYETAPCDFGGQTLLIPSCGA